MADIDLLLEAERRGILPQDRLDMLQEARKRGLAPAPLPGAVTAAEPSAQATAQKKEERIPELSAREPDTSEWLADKTGMSSDYWRRTLWNLKAPSRVLEGAEAPAQGLTQGLLHAGSYATSLGGYAPNALSRVFGNAAGTMDTTLQRQEEQYQTERANAGVEPGTTDYSRMAGTAVSPVTTATAGALGARAGANILSRLYGAARTGAAIGAEQPVTSGGENYAGTKAEQAETGAAIGAGMELGAGAVAPWVRDQAQHLAERYGIRVPIGKAIGESAGRLEEMGQSVPLSGMAVRSAYGTANQDLARAVNNEASAPLEPFGFGFRMERDAPISRQVAATRGDQISASYQDVIPRLRGQIDQELTNAIAAERASIPPRLQQNFDEEVQQYLLSKQGPGGSLNGQDLKNADIDLRERGRELVQSNGPADDKLLGRSLVNVRDAVHNMWERHSAPEDVAQLQATDAAYGMHKIAERAETSSAAPEGQFGPTQLWQAVKAGDPTLGKRALSRGEARLQDLADNAKAVLGKTVADSGTPERAATIGLGHVLTGGAGVAFPAATVGSIAGHAAMYSPLGQNALRALAGGFPATRETAANAIRQISPGISAVMVSKQPYDNAPRSVREWQAIHQQKLNAARQAIGYYGQQ